MIDRVAQPYEIGEVIRFGVWGEDPDVAWTVTGATPVGEDGACLMMHRMPPFEPGYFQHKTHVERGKPIIRYFNREPLIEAEDWERVRVVRDDGGEQA